MGSYHRLITFFTELPTERDVWGEPVMMESCSNCSACVAACAADVITPDRSVIFAERCITYHNEEPVDVPFPEWMEPSWHECIVGCLYCQRVCPVNREIGGQFIDGGEFTEEETSSFLKATSLDNLPATTLKKLEDSGLIVFNEILPRNLKVLLGQVDSK
ncbi:MAG: hypothetical protein GY771_05970 [bacterium]|nr:hypothetical protein [bacterium]